MNLRTLVNNIEVCGNVQTCLIFPHSDSSGYLHLPGKTGGVGADYYNASFVDVSKPILDLWLSLVRKGELVRV